MLLFNCKFASAIQPQKNHAITNKLFRYLRGFAPLVIDLIICTFILLGCGYAGTPPNSKPIVVTITPLSVTLGPGAAQQFSATVSNTSNTGVTWEVNGVSGGSTTTGTISPAGLYLAPSPAPASSVTVTAVSLADASSSGSGTVNFQSAAITISISPTAVTVPTGGAQIFIATISGTSSQQIIWSVNGISGGTSSTGTIVSTGTLTAAFTAPSSVPSQNPVTVTATSVADATKSASAAVTIACASSNSISPATASVSLGQSQAFAAVLCIVPGSTIVWDVDGIIGGNSTVGTIASTSSGAAQFNAPENVPAQNPVSIHATSGGASATASVTLLSGVEVSISPASATIAPSQSEALTPAVTGSSDTNVSWTVNGVPNGSASVGFICVASTNPCTPPAAAFAAAVNYVAPAAAPSQNPVSVVATSEADSTRSATSQITITSGGSVGTLAGIAPQYLFIAATGGAPSTQQFYALAAEGSNVPVTWTVASAVHGSGCTASACGTINPSGLYTAPGSAPSPNAIAVTATSQGASPQALTATVTIKTGPTIEILLPSSVTAGAIEGFPLELQGLNFVSGSGSSGSVILINGSQRTTTCSSSSICATALNASDVASAGTLTVQILNPGGALSNPVPFVVAPFASTPTTLSLTSSQSALASIPFAVTEATTSAASAQLNVNFLGFLSGVNNCDIGAAPLTVTRPSSGTQAVSICVQGNGLDPTFSYSFGGPVSSPGGSDIPVTPTSVPGLLPNMIELTFEISSSTTPGLRTLTITTLNGDRAAATGMLEIQ